MSERERNGGEHGASPRRCAVCGTPNLAGDRFCAECGALLPTLVPAPASPADGETAPLPGSQPGISATAASAAPGKPEREDAAWIFGARPTAVIGGGVLLLVLAAALLAIGQRDDTGTIVMLSICAAPLGLLVLLIGIARSIAATTRRR